jgi:hypothetical protein
VGPDNGGHGGGNFGLANGTALPTSALVGGYTSARDVQEAVIVQGR